MLKPVKRPGSPFYIARGTIAGRRIERSTGETRKGKAEERCVAIEAEERAKLIIPRSWKDMPFAEALGAYVDTGKDPRFLTKVLDHFETTPLGAIDNPAMARAAAALYPGRQPATIRRQLYVPVTAIINFVRDERLRAPKGGGARTMFVMPALADSIIQAATTQPSPWLAALITFLFGQGTRTGETFAIDGKNDLDLAGRWVMLRDTKNGHERRVTLQPRVIAALSILPNIGEAGPLFRRFDGGTFAQKIGRGGQVRTAFARAVTDGGGDPALITPHICRHSWATWYYAQTRDILRLKEEGGWRSSEYQRYVKLATSDIGDEALRLGWTFGHLGENRGKLEPQEAKSVA